MSTPRMHHTGFVVASIAESAPSMAQVLSLPWDGVIVHDPLQFVRVAFIPSQDTRGASIELVEPAGPRSPVRKFAEAGGGIHHVCYEVDDLREQLAASLAGGATVVRVPLPAKAFNGRKIAWVVTPQKLLVEYLERG